MFLKEHNGEAILIMALAGVGGKFKDIVKLIEFDCETLFWEAVSMIKPYRGHHFSAKIIS